MDSLDDNARPVDQHPSFLNLFNGFNARSLDWQEDAACLGTDPEAWFPDNEGAEFSFQFRICAGCSIRQECLDWAMVHDEAGLWAGTSHRERRRMKERGEWLPPAQRGTPTGAPAVEPDMRTPAPSEMKTGNAGSVGGLGSSTF